MSIDLSMLLVSGAKCLRGGSTDALACLTCEVFFAKNNIFSRNCPKCTFK